ncbi:putative primase/helicase protein [Pseudomonas phage MR2]|uniref:Putative primase/helicase protein n=1 Tax=Pseudomonas phage MR2 TaxID=2711170 RepID=A0A6M3T8U9_9CAUD|nr:putative primase/helicase protein [Pseudomonas phage MR2]
MSSSEDREESVFIAHIPCETCGSSDANSLFSDGHQYCFACDPKEAYKAPDGKDRGHGNREVKRNADTLVMRECEGRFQDLPARFLQRPWAWQP